MPLKKWQKNVLKKAKDSLLQLPENKFRQLLEELADFFDT